MKMQMNEIGRHGYRRLYRSPHQGLARVRKTAQFCRTPSQTVAAQRIPHFSALHADSSLTPVSNLHIPQQIHFQRLSNLSGLR